jgi:aminopeptidase N
MNQNLLKPAVLFAWIFTSLAAIGGNNYHFFAPPNYTNYDVVYHRISLAINPGSSAAITAGSVTTYFKTTTGNVSNIQFDLDCSNMIVSSVTYHGSPASFTTNTTTDILSITIPAIAIQGTLDSVFVAYSGTPVLAPASGVPSGYNYKNHGSPSVKEVYTLSEPYTGHYWWPCKETLYDKIDSVDLVITAPNTYKVAGNGKLTEVPSGANTITTWKTRYPIAAYLINFAIANFQNYQFTINAGSTMMPVMNYIFSEDNTTTMHTAVDVLKNILPMYISKFGDYPFGGEKYGLAECTSGWGALEVQSMTFVASDAFDKYTLAHELAHQWFGDKVTTSSWHQIWLNEGFAKYCESIIFPENLYPAELAAKRSGLKTSVTNTSTTYVTDTTTPNSIFIGSTTQPYEKGAMILSMLRAWLGDTNFFAALNSYLHAPGIAYAFTSVDSLEKYMEATKPGLDLSNFFGDWVQKKGRAQYTVKYQYVTNGVYIQLTQSPTSAGAGYFDMPVPLEIKNGSGLDTTIIIADKRGVLYNNVTNGTYNSNTIYFKLSGTPTIAPIFDPNSQVLATASSIAANATLNTLITLPFRQVKLSATEEDNATRLKWDILTDEDLQSIVIEKSDNGINFNLFRTFSPVLTGTEEYEGNCLDNSGNTGDRYYRLKVIKKDNSFVYSSIEFLRGKKSLRLQLFPNPTKDEITVLIPAGFVTGSLELIITDMMGKTVKRVYFSDTNKATISLQELHSGLYHAKLTDQSGLYQTADFIKY